ncbi:hypothetical protein TWF481_002675 [Arthrobotrys musiformis]|uniref:C2H2-type domain-containing protein n=1 Tax=Arthrobotrys musiformis TaxID=47236 RepID=A0AAV9VQW9_9PEZI
MGPSADISSRFQAGLRDSCSRTKIACQHCRWVGSNLQKHMADEHSNAVMDQQVADESKPNATSTGAGAAAASFGPQAQAGDSMQVDEAPAAAASATPAATPSARPHRRKPVGGGGGRRVDSADPDSVRNPRRGGSQASAGRLYDPRSDFIKPSAQTSSRPAPAQRSHVAPPSSPRAAQRLSNQSARNPIPASAGHNPVLMKKQATPAPVLTTQPVPPAGSTSVSSPPTVHPSSDADDSEPQPPTELILQPETRPISQEQLIAEYLRRACYGRGEVYRSRFKASRCCHSRYQTDASSQQ